MFESYPVKIFEETKRIVLTNKKQLVTLKTAISM